MKHLSTILVLLFVFSSSRGTNQVKDILICGEDTLDLYESPLEQAYGIDAFQIGQELYGVDSMIISSACWRGFVAEWIIKDSLLYLSNVKECHTSRNINHVIEKLLGRSFVNGLVKAEWVNGQFWCGLDYAETFSLYITIYEQEYSLRFKNGAITELKEYHYRPCEIGSEEELKLYIFNRIDWDQCPLQKRGWESFSVYIESDESGTIKNVVIENSKLTTCEHEIRRILWTLPCINVYFHEGKFWDIGMSSRIEINQKNIDKYVR